MVEIVPDVHLLCESLISLVRNYQACNKSFYLSEYCIALRVCSDVLESYYERLAVWPVAVLPRIMELSLVNVAEATTPYSFSRLQWDAAREVKVA